MSNASQVTTSAQFLSLAPTLFFSLSFQFCQDLVEQIELFLPHLSLSSRISRKADNLPTFPNKKLNKPSQCNQTVCRRPEAMNSDFFQARPRLAHHKREPVEGAKTMKPIFSESPRSGGNLFRLFSASHSTITVAALNECRFPTDIESHFVQHQKQPICDFCTLSVAHSYGKWIRKSFSTNTSLLMPDWQIFDPALSPSLCRFPESFEKGFVAPNQLPVQLPFVPATEARENHAYADYQLHCGLMRRNRDRS
jgi:hypothetical protein